jgi:hypothetical protein
MTYEESVASLVHKFLYNKAGVMRTPAPLWHALGCLHVATATDHGFVFVTPPQPAPAHEDLVVKTLLLAMHLQTPLTIVEPPDNVASILDGLLRHDRWRHCLGSHGTAIEFATLLTAFSESAAGSTCCRILLRQVAVPVCSVLNAWLKPEAPFSGGPVEGPAAAYKMALAMFGDAWCALALSGLTDEQHWKIPQIILAQRPPFLPGLLPEHLTQANFSLPVLDTP